MVSILILLLTLNWRCVGFQTNTHEPLLHICYCPAPDIIPYTKQIKKLLLRQSISLVEWLSFHLPSLEKPILVEMNTANHRKSHPHNATVWGVHLWSWITPLHKHSVTSTSAELGLFHAILAFCGTLVPKNVEIIQEIPSSASGTYLYHQSRAAFLR